VEGEAKDGDPTKQDGAESEFESGHERAVSRNRRRGKAGLCGTWLRICT